mmetsp:Transcript_106347/g.211266  ORF Transcript_106347/g.211266 Transcript_106347/m.211266 type:complete len:119 (-) Transcript_106347:175-531(-)
MPLSKNQEPSAVSVVVVRVEVDAVKVMVVPVLVDVVIVVVVSVTVVTVVEEETVVVEIVVVVVVLNPWQMYIQLGSLITPDTESPKITSPDTLMKQPVRLRVGMYSVTLSVMFKAVRA